MLVAAPADGRRPERMGDLGPPRTSRESPRMPLPGPGIPPDWHERLNSSHDGLRVRPCNNGSNSGGADREIATLERRGGGPARSQRERILDTLRTNQFRPDEWTDAGRTAVEVPSTDGPSLSRVLRSAILRPTRSRWPAASSLPVPRSLPVAIGGTGRRPFSRAPAPSTPNPNCN